MRRLVSLLGTVLALGAMAGTGCTSIGREIAVSRRDGCPPGAFPNETVRTTFYGVESGDIEAIKIWGDGIKSFRGQPVIVVDPALKGAMLTALKKAYQTSEADVDPGDHDDGMTVIFKPKQGKTREPYVIEIPPWGPYCLFGKPFLDCLPLASRQQAELARKYVRSLGTARQVRAIRLVEVIDGRRTPGLRVTDKKQVEALWNALAHLDESAFDFYYIPYRVEIERTNGQKATLTLFIRPTGQVKRGAVNVPDPLCGYIATLEHRHKR